MRDSLREPSFSNLSSMSNVDNKSVQILWSPPDASATNMDRFRRRINSRKGLDLKNYQDLHAWSTSPETAADFWIELFTYQNLQAGVVPPRATEVEGPELKMFPPPRFFPDVTLNFTEHFFQDKDPTGIAIYSCTEGLREIQEVRWRHLHSRMKALADAMRTSGLRKGDRVAAVITNCVEAVVACLATLSIGAIFSTSSPDMGVDGIMDRLKQIQPRFVIFESSVVYNGKVRLLKAKIKECVLALRRIPGFQQAIVIDRERAGLDMEAEVSSMSWDQFLERDTGRPLHFEQMPFDHPGFIVYSSGTTGLPKCIVHSAAGLLMKVKTDYILHLDVRSGDTIYQYSTTGWIMWPMLICGLAYGSRIVLYDGSPTFPDPMVTLRLVERLKITLFGTSARFLADLMLLGLKPKHLVDLSSLRTVSSTGSVLTREVYEWFYNAGFPRKVHLVSGSGGTDLAGSLVNGDPTSAVYAGEIQRPALGMAIDILDSEVQEPMSIANTGRSGELVCRMPFPSQPVRFWGNDGQKRYRDAYFERFGSKVWCQGDFVSLNPHTGGYYMLGRSDGVLNPSGVRFGSAEIYNAIVHISEFEETICVGQRRPHDLDETVLLFVKMKENKPLTQALVLKTKAMISAQLTPRHVPKYILQVPEIPYTINGKKIELAVKHIVSGRHVKPSGAVANPESLQLYERFVDMKKVVEEGRVRAVKL